MTIPSPIEMMVGTNETIARIVDNQEMIRSSKFDMLCHLHCEFNTRVGGTWYTPGLGAIIETLAKDLLELQKILLVTQVIFPA